MTGFPKSCDFNFLSFKIIFLINFLIKRDSSKITQFFPLTFSFVRVVAVVVVVVAAAVVVVVVRNTSVYSDSNNTLSLSLRSHLYSVENIGK